MKKYFLLAITFAFYGCVPQTQGVQLANSHYVTYDIVLKAIQLPSGKEVRYDDPKIVMAEEQGYPKKGFLFEDDAIEAIWFPGSYDFEINLTNKTPHTMKILWDEVVYVDEHKSSNRVLHSGVKYADRNSSQPPTIVPRGSAVSDKIVPTNKAYFNTALSGGWSYHPLFPVLGNGEAILDSQVRHLLGERVQILMPVEVQDKTYEYIFIFSIDGYVIDEVRL